MRELPLAGFQEPWKIWIVFLLALVIAHGVVLVTYRLVFSPIAHFPGPKIAAATSWYEFCYDVLRPGMYIFEIEKMHKKYGKCHFRSREYD